MQRTSQLAAVRTRYFEVRVPVQKNSQLSVVLPQIKTTSLNLEKQNVWLLIPQISLNCKKRIIWHLYFLNWKKIIIWDCYISKQPLLNENFPEHYLFIFRICFIHHRISLFFLFLRGITFFFSGWYKIKSLLLSDRVRKILDESYLKYEFQMA